MDLISIHAPLAGCDKMPMTEIATVVISIHAPLAGCDFVRYRRRVRQSPISIHAPLAGCDLHKSVVEMIDSKFQSTHPLRGATAAVLEPTAAFGISIHAPLAGCDTAQRIKEAIKAISIHAPLAGCDIWPFTSDTTERYFNPRTPCGVRRPWTASLGRPRRFQSTHPLRGATFRLRVRRGDLHRFQSTHPLRGATRHQRHALGQPQISIHAPLAGCDIIDKK